MSKVLMYDAQVISDKHEDVMAKFGAILAQGIIDASGRNVTVSLQSRSGHTNMAAVVGLLVFNQFWYELFFTQYPVLTSCPNTSIFTTYIYNFTFSMQNIVASVIIFEFA